jgi:hypothetical protein
MDGLWRSVRWPVAALLLSTALVVVAFVLDAQPAGRARDTALLIGAPALFVLLPLSVLWLVVALVLHVRRHEHH